MTRLQQLDSIEREVLARLVDEKPQDVYTTIDLSKSAFHRLKSGGKGLSLATLRALACYFDCKDKDSQR
ncbi:hypothetical protein HOV93_08140 [Planctomycetes bacterium FF15]|uniref:Uncharacterized protein n=1 Tax=Bremerella alba TaxID=980252 RepID=A0A7V8V2X2_9BACT|nr:hypothetical protein [Bremerella alba]